MRVRARRPESVGAPVVADVALEVVVVPLLVARLENEGMPAIGGIAPPEPAKHFLLYHFCELFQQTHH